MRRSEARVLAGSVVGLHWCAGGSADGGGARVEAEVFPALDADEEDAIRAAADAAGLDRSAFLRVAALTEVARRTRGAAA